MAEQHGQPPPGDNNNQRVPLRFQLGARAQQRQAPNFVPQQQPEEQLGNGQEHHAPLLPEPHRAARQHAYLGNVQQVPQDAEQRDGGLRDFSILNVCVCVLPGVVLFPGETLPLRLHRHYDPGVIALADRILARNNSAAAAAAGAGGEAAAASSSVIANFFGVVCGALADRGTPGAAHALGEVSTGTLASIVSGQRVGEEQVVLLARGTRRFRVERLLGYRQVSTLLVFTVLSHITYSNRVALAAHVSVLTVIAPSQQLSMSSGCR
jgi:ATP-dependent protease La (LON) substrate-binding domain